MVNSIVIERKNYDNDNEFWSAVSMFLRLLTENDYIATFKYEDCGVYVIEFSYKDQSMGAEYPYWLTPEQYEQINFNEDDSYEDCESELLE